VYFFFFFFSFFFWPPDRIGGQYCRPTMRAAITTVAIIGAVLAVLVMITMASAMWSTARHRTTETGDFYRPDTGGARSDGGAKKMGAVPKENRKRKRNREEASITTGPRMKEHAYRGHSMAKLGTADPRNEYDDERKEKKSENEAVQQPPAEGSTTSSPGERELQAVEDIQAELIDEVSALTVISVQDFRDISYVHFGAMVHKSLRPHEARWCR